MLEDEIRIERLLESNFDLNRPKPFEKITDVCRNAADEEAIEEASPFLGKKWIDVTPEIWREHWCALTFLSDQAFGYFLPSLIKASLHDYPSTINAVDSCLCGMPRVSQYGEKNDHNLERWRQLSISQIQCVAEWISWLEKRHIKDCSSLNLAKDSINQLLQVKTHQPPPLGK
jgi:hypothetical protein